MMILAGWIGVSVGFVLGVLWAWALRVPPPWSTTDRVPASAAPTAIASGARTIGLALH